MGSLPAQRQLPSALEGFRSTQTQEQLPCFNQQEDRKTPSTKPQQPSNMQAGHRLYFNPVFKNQSIAGYGLYYYHHHHHNHYYEILTLSKEVFKLYCFIFLSFNFLFIPSDSSFFIIQHFITITGCLNCKTFSVFPILKQALPLITQAGTEDSNTRLQRLQQNIQAVTRI